MPGPSCVTSPRAHRTIAGMGRWIAVLAGLGAGMLAGCLVELDTGLACGDEYHDRSSEECDPGDADSIPNNCACDPQTCKLTCCGNGVIEGDEVCDGDNWTLRPTCEDPTCVSCEEVRCPRCGNAEIDGGEECDIEFDELATKPIDCQDIPVPGRPGQTYLPGGSPTCRADCHWDRSTCNLCGNGELDDEIIDPNTGSPINAAERCDGPAFDLAERFERCLSVCGEDGRDCKASCGEGCLEIEVDPGDSGCCVRPGYARTAGVPCCCELPEAEVPEYCTDVFDPPLGGGSDDGTTAPTCPG